MRSVAAVLALTAVLAGTAGIARGDSAARWRVIVSDVDRGRDGTQVGAVDIGLDVALAARARVRAPVGKVRMRLSTFCAAPGRQVNTSYRSTGKWVVKALPRGRGQCYRSVTVWAGPGTLRLMFELLQ
jgi:hypothetical protein